MISNKTVKGNYTKNSSWFVPSIAVILFIPQSAMVTVTDCSYTGLEATTDIYI